MGRHTAQEIDALGLRAVSALSQVLGDNEYLTGAKLGGADATAYAFALGTLCKTFDMPLRAAVESHPNIVSYCERMRQSFE